MPDPRPLSVRPFRRSDREQLTGLVNAHIGAVVPGWAVSVNAVLSQLERDTGEHVVEPWVVDRAAFVAVRGDAVVGGAFLKRYRPEGGGVTPAYADAGEITWLVFWPDQPDAGEALLATGVAQLDRWAVSQRFASGDLPSPCTYGVCDCWPHIRAAYEAGGLKAGGQIEILLVAEVADLPRAGTTPPVEGLTVRREVGYLHATRFAARLGGREVGGMNVQVDLTAGGTLSRLAGWAGAWALDVEEPLRRRGVATWLLGHVADWMRLGRADRLIDQAWPSEEDRVGFLLARGFRELTRTEKVWTWPGTEPTPR